MNERQPNRFEQIVRLNKLQNEKVFYKDKRIIFYNNDVLNENCLPTSVIDLIVTSPPYNVGIEYKSNNDELAYQDYLDFSFKWIKNCFLWSTKQARFLLNIPLDKNKGGQHAVGADLIHIARKAGWKYHSTIVWNEGNISRRTAWGSWLSASAPYVIAPVELIIILYKDEWKKTNGSKINDITKNDFMNWTNGLWTFNGESKKRIGHPAPFPRELPKRCIKLFSYIDDVVLDPFLGSGTTMIEASLNNRYGIGLELNKEYCAIAKSRIVKETLPDLDMINFSKMPYNDYQKSL